MTFLESIMLLGLAAVSVPVIIHLLNRHKAKVVEWGAMRFLLDSLAIRNRRILVEEIILLVLRSLLVALLVLAMARPFLPSTSVIPWPIVLPALLAAAVCAAIAGAMWNFRRRRWILLGIAGGLVAISAALSIVEQVLQHRRWRAGGGAKDVVIVLDASMSMKRVVGDKTQFQRALGEVREAIQACQPSDSIGLILAGSVPRRLTDSPTADRKDLQALLSDERLVAPTDGSLRVPDALNAAAELLAKGHNAGKKIVLVTDGQSVGWDVRNQARWDYLAKSLRGFLHPPQVICRVLDMPEGFRNLAVTDIALSHRVVGPDRPVFLDVQIANTGTTPMPAASLELVLDDGQVVQREVGEIASGAVETVRFEHRFTRSGPNQLTARLRANDELPADDALVRVVNVISRLPALVVDGSPSPRPLEGAGEFLRYALSPEEDGGSVAGEGDEEDVPFLIEPDVIDALNLTTVEDLDKYRLVVLANVPRLPAAFAARLEHFVRRGGGLLIAAGGRIETSFYNLWTGPAGEPVCPAKLGERKTHTEAPARLAIATFNHPALALMADASKSDAAAAAVTSYWTVTTDAADPSVRIAAQLETGDPFLVERHLGRGFVMLSTEALDGRDSNLPRLKCFVSLVQEAARHLAAPLMAEMNVPPARELSVEIPAAVAAGGADRGLLGQYFRGTDLRDLKLTRVDAAVDFQWGFAGPDRQLPPDGFSVRWSGSVQAPRKGQYTFYVSADDGVRMYVKGKKVIDDWRDTATVERRANVSLNAGQPVDLVVEYYEATNDAQVKLMWSGPNLPKQVVPAASLCPYSAKLPGGVKRTEAPPPPRTDSWVEAPDGQRRPARLAVADGAWRISFEGGAEPGLYHAVLGSGARVPFVVLGNSEESRLSVLDAAEFQRASERTGLFRARTTSEMTTAIAGGVPGEELWKYLALGALACLVGEIALSRWITIRRRGHVDETVSFGSDATADVQAYRARAREMLKVPAAPAATAGSKK
ncbi:MAG TPA: PA14 domain-containing protein [Phycisphaerae bacterium]|nr:PA14 domain-containing protein [Phycisphaerae bacterium]